MGTGEGGGERPIFKEGHAGGLYIGFRCFREPGVRPRAKVTGRDGPVWEDDAVELFFQPDPANLRYYQFIGNSRGAFAG